MMSDTNHVSYLLACLGYIGMLLLSDHINQVIFMTYLVIFWFMCGWWSVGTIVPIFKNLRTEIKVSDLSIKDLQYGAEVINKKNSVFLAGQASIFIICGIVGIIYTFWFTALLNITYGVLLILAYFKIRTIMKAYYQNIVLANELKNTHN